MNTAKLIVYDFCDLIPKDSDIHLASTLSLLSLLTVMKILGPITDFPTWGSGKGTKTLREFDLEASGIWLQNWRRNGETDSRRAQKKSCVHQDPGERSSDPRREWPRLACEFTEVSSGGLGRQWPAAGLGDWTLQVLLKEVGIILITSSIVWSQVKQQWRNTAPPINRNWIIDLLSMALPIRTRSNFPHSQSLPSGSFRRSLTLIHHLGRMRTNHNHRKLTKLITWTTAMFNSVILWAMLHRATQNRWIMLENSENMWSRRREWKTTSVFLPWEPHEQ